MNFGSFPQSPSRVAILTSRTFTTASLTANEKLLTACIIVLTVTSSIIVNVRSFFSDFPQVVNFLFQIATSTLVSIPLPTVEKEMNVEPAQLQWIVSGYPLSSVSKA